ncbi:MAG: MBL fold metallo-hydrolase [bacterium]|nr:MBL fold metallo-hydrolase [bacterium]
MIQLGDFQIHLINDSFARVEAGGVFGLVPRALWRGYCEPDAENQVPMAYHNLLIHAHGKHIVVDTGYGRRMTEKQIRNFQLTRPTGDLLDALARIGLPPEAVDLVINTHLHGDHCGGNLIAGDDGALRPAFPNAEYVVQRREYDDALRPNERTRATYSADNFAPLVASGQMRLLDGDTDLLPGVRGVVTPGHVPGHMSVIVESGGGSLMFVCDLASWGIHFEKLGWMTAYDVEPLVTLETKRIWQRWALDTDALLVFPHDPLHAIGRLRSNADGRTALHYVDEAYA